MDDYTRHPYLLGVIYSGQTRVSLWSSQGCPDNTPEAVLGVLRRMCRDNGTQKLESFDGATVLVASRSVGDDLAAKLYGATLYKISIPTPTLSAQLVTA